MVYGSLLSDRVSHEIMFFVHAGSPPLCTATWTTNVSQSWTSRWLSRILSFLNNLWYFVLHSNVLLQSLFRGWCILTLFTLECKNGWILLLNISLVSCFGVLRGDRCRIFNHFFSDFRFPCFPPPVFSPDLASRFFLLVLITGAVVVL